MTRRVVRVKRRTFDRYVNRDQKIKSCEGVYPLRATAEYFGLSHAQVDRIWKRESASDFEPPNIENTKRHPALYDDGIILLARGLSLREAALQLGVRQTHLAQVLKARPTGLELLDRDRDASEAWKRGRSNPQGSYGVCDGIDYPNAY